MCIVFLVDSSCRLVPLPQPRLPVWFWVPRGGAEDDNDLILRCPYSGAEQSKAKARGPCQPTHPHLHGQAPPSRVPNTAPQAQDSPRKRIVYDLSSGRSRYLLYSPLSHSSHPTMPSSSSSSSSSTNLDNILPALHHALSGATGTAISTCTTYPLSLVLTRLQVQVCVFSVGTVGMPSLFSHVTGTQRTVYDSMYDAYDTPTPTPTQDTHKG